MILEECVCGGWTSRYRQQNGEERSSLGGDPLDSGLINGANCGGDLKRKTPFSAKHHPSSPWISTDLSAPYRCRDQVLAIIPDTRRCRLLCYNGVTMPAEYPLLLEMPEEENEGTPAPHPYLFFHSRRLMSNSVIGSCLHAHDASQPGLNALALQPPQQRACLGVSCSI